LAMLALLILETLSAPMIPRLSASVLHLQQLPLASKTLPSRMPASRMNPRLPPARMGAPRRPLRTRPLTPAPLLLSSSNNRRIQWMTRINPRARMARTSPPPRMARTSPHLKTERVRLQLKTWTQPPQTRITPPAIRRQTYLPTAITTAVMEVHAIRGVVEAWTPARARYPPDSIINPKKLQSDPGDGRPGNSLRCAPASAPGRFVRYANPAQGSPKSPARS
jgi:hypothetical protein